MHELSQHNGPSAYSAVVLSSRAVLPFFYCLYLQHCIKLSPGRRNAYHDAPENRESVIRSRAIADCTRAQLRLEKRAPTKCCGSSRYRRRHFSEHPNTKYVHCVLSAHAPHTAHDAIQGAYWGPMLHTQPGQHGDGEANSYI